LSKVLVIGDLILDSYTYGTATRLCPEAPVPVIMPTADKTETRGGAGLVADQLIELIGAENVITHFGSKSRKERIFADGRLICRVDYDSLEVSDSAAFHRAFLPDFKKVDLVIVSDYNKGALCQDLATEIRCSARARNIPVLVDAKTNWKWYSGCFAAFPNQNEGTGHTEFNHIIEKNGERGCFVDDVPVYPQHKRAVGDVSGAGDIFLAAFAANLLNWQNIIGSNEHEKLVLSAKFANLVAGISVEYVGTHVVRKSEIDASN
jgi:bifunctional ADP-heptose synthase (sugar kinase/adenylyltransferase)